jgi:hypothetical protein
MSAFSKKYENRPNNILSWDRVQRTTELTRPFVHDLVNQQAVFVGHCDLVSDDLEQGSQSAKRVVAI